MNSLINRTEAINLCIVLLIGMIVLVALGRLASRAWNKEEREPRGGVGSLLTALYALSGFILAFTFGMSGNRLERIRLVVETEANNIGTAILRADLYPDSVREGFRADFKSYLGAVIDFYGNAKKLDRLYAAKEDAKKAAEKLWARATSQSKVPGMLIPSSQMIPSLNDMFDIATTREVVLKEKIPDLIIIMLFACVLATCFIGGFTSARFHSKDLVIIMGFSVITAMVVYTTLDLARPLRGVIREKAGQEAIQELQNMFTDVGKH